MDNSILVLQQKRWRAAKSIFWVSLGVGSATAVPAPAFGLIKQLGVTVMDVRLLWELYEIYFQQKLSLENFWELAKKAGIATSVAGVLTFAVVKISNSIAEILTKWAGPFGWAINAIVNGSTTLTMACAWWFFVDKLYQDKNGMTSEEVDYQKVEE